jgi:hypothetical protein
MSLLRAINLPQDENACAVMMRGMPGKAGAPLQLQGKADGPLKQQPLGARKPFGSSAGSNAGPEKAALSSRPTEKRRALGDITNARSSAIKQEQAGPLKPTSHTPAPSAAAAPLPQAAPQREAPEVQWAREGVERSAGRGWQQLEQQRRQQEERGIAARLKMVAEAMPPFAVLPYMQVRACVGAACARRGGALHAALHAGVRRALPAWRAGVAGGCTAAGGAARAPR